MEQGGMNGDKKGRQMERNTERKREKKGARCVIAWLEYD